MQSQHIIVIPPTHEQTAPAFHVEGSLATDFEEYLKARGFEAWEPPKKLEKLGADHLPVVEIEMEAETSTEKMEELAEDFIAKHATETH